MLPESTILSEIIKHEELSRLLPMISGITIIEYDGDDIQGSIGLHDYLSDNGLSVDIVDRIIVCGRRMTPDNIVKLRSLFPSIEPELTNKGWEETDFGALKVHDVLVFHMVGKEVSCAEFDEQKNEGKRLLDVVLKTRKAYYVCVFLDSYLLDFLGLEQNYLRTELRLTEFASQDKDEIAAPTAFCKEKQEFIKMCRETLISKDLFFQCFEEAEHECEECNQCSKYGKRKQCPFAQRIIAEFYRKGIYVPQDKRIAHQWESMASRQGYKPAHVQIADDYSEGSGCEQSKSKAFEIYNEYAQKNDEYCIKRIVELAEEGEGKERIAALPYIVKLAKGGDEDMTLKLSQAFQNGDFGLPKDIVQQEEWIRQGAENGNPRFVKAMAEMYENNSDWEKAYKWYKKLAEVGPDMLAENKLEEVEIKMLTDGLSDEEIAQRGMNYLYGYHGIERDTHLAFRCLSYASGKNIPLATGLLGKMYYYGLGIEKDERKGASLVVSASNDDLLSMEMLVYQLLGTEYVNAEWTVMVDVYDEMEDDINQQIDVFRELEGDLFNAVCAELDKAKPNPIAHYLYSSFLSSEEESFGEMKKAAGLGYPPAQYELAIMYRDGKGVPMSSTLYRQWLKTSADNGHYEAEGLYGIMLFNSLSLERPKAFRFLKEAIDQQYESAEAYWCLAQCYMLGYGTAKNEALAYPMYIKAAENGNVNAQVKLCKDYFNGYEYLPRNFSECAHWGEAAIAKGNKSVRFDTAYAQSYLGNHTRAKELYLELSKEGNAAAMNNYACELTLYSEKAEWFQKAADAGDDYGMWNIGKYYRDGKGVTKDIGKAIELLTKSAELGCEGAIEDLASMYRNGEGVVADGKEAIRWYSLGVDKGYHRFLLDIAEMYYEGKVVKKDSESAIHYYKLAAEKGIDKAILKLGEIYQNGKGEEKNIQKAIFWYRKAAANGSEMAKRRLKRLGANWIEDGEIEA